jgi:hypothetical protein
MAIRFHSSGERAGEVNESENASTGMSGMSGSDLTFVIFRDVKDGGYKWRLRSAGGETLEVSERGHRH